MSKKPSSSQIMYASIIVAVLMVVVITPFGTYHNRPAANPEDAEMRISPVARVEVKPLNEQASASGSAAPQSPPEVAGVSAVAAAQQSNSFSSAANGSDTYTAACAVCHNAGVAGAPRNGDKVAWSPRIAQGIETLYDSALKGKNTMPPKGGHLTLSDEAVKAAVDYMVGASQ